MQLKVLVGTPVVTLMFVLVSMAYMAIDIKWNRHSFMRAVSCLLSDCCFTLLTIIINTAAYFALRLTREWRELLGVCVGLQIVIAIYLFAAGMKSAVRTQDHPDGVFIISLAVLQIAAPLSIGLYTKLVPIWVTTICTLFGTVAAIYAITVRCKQEFK